MSPLLLQECANKEDLEGSDLEILVNYCPSHFAARLDNIFGIGVLQILSDEVENPLSHYPEADAVYPSLTLNITYKHKEQLSARNFWYSCSYQNLHGGWLLAGRKSKRFKTIWIVISSESSIQNICCPTHCVLTITTEP